MIKISLKDGNVLEFKKGTSVIEIAKSISEGLARVATCAEINGEIVDLRYEVNEDSSLVIHTFESSLDGKKAYWHTSSHILAEAVKRLFPEAKLAIGPAIDEGFYYDFDIEKPFSDEDKTKIEAEMKKIIKENNKIEKFVLPKNEALKLMGNEPYKIELINELEDGEEISFYKQGEFTDLCAGPHLESTGKIKSIKILSSSGAYWRGNEKNKMLQRIYAISFPKASQLDEYINMLEEARSRDHNKLGRELELFTTVPEIGQGLPVLLPKGSTIIQTLQRFVEDEERKRGYQLTKTPLMAKSDLYKISGHWDHYRDGMFIMGDEESDEELFALRPMTCPFQFMAYKNRQRSYRDLPLRYNETSTLFRNEESGEMHGLIRVRQFTISEGHLAVRIDQLEDEIKGCVELVNYFMNILGLQDDISFRFSKWDPNNREKYLGDEKDWEYAQASLKNILDHLNINYYEAEGEAAFYGPKLDIQCKNVWGKEDTIITIQVDFQLAERFDMTYIDKEGNKVRPVVIHRTSLGCYERTLAILIEKYAGAFPTWIAPIQVKILPIGENQIEYADKLFTKLRDLGIRVEFDDSSEKIGYKIRKAQLEKVPYMLVIGEKEVQENKVAIRSRKNGDEGAISVEEFIKKIQKEIEEKIR